MSVDFTLETLSPDDVRSQELILIDLLQEKYQDYDFSEGTVNRDFLIRLNAYLSALSQKKADYIRNHINLYQYFEDPSNIDTDLLIKLLANYGVVQQEATYCQGTLRVYVSDFSSFIIYNTTEFKVGNRTFKPIQTYYVVAAQDVAENGTTKQLLSDITGKYFYVDVAVRETVSGNGGLVKGTELTLVNANNIPTFIKAITLTEFEVGLPKESVQSAISRFKDSYIPSIISSPLSIAKVLKQKFPNITRCEVLHSRSNVKLRFAPNIFNFASVNQVDILVKTGTYLSEKNITIETNAIYPQNDAIIAEIVIPPTVAPGFYYIQLSNLIKQDGAEISQLLFNNIYTTGTYVPLLYTSSDARFTQYQGAASLQIYDTRSSSEFAKALLDTIAITGEVVTTFFTDRGLYNSSITASNVAQFIAANKRLYSVTLYYITDIDTIQQYVVQPANRMPGVDMLVRAFIPMFIGSSFKLYIRNYANLNLSTLGFSLDILKQEIVNKFVQSSLPQAVTNKFIYDAVSSVFSRYSLEGYIAGPITLTGYLYKLNGTTQVYSSTTHLACPTNVVEGIAPETVQFYTNAGLHNIEVISYE